MNPLSSLYERYARKKKGLGGWISRNLIVQPIEWQLAETLALIGPEDRGAPPVGDDFDLVHVINFFPPPDETVRKVQAHVTASMRAAWARAPERVKIGNTQLADEADQTPEGFLRCPPLEKEIGQFLPAERRLTLIFEILARAAALAGPDDYIIYTNSDVSLRANFYVTVRELIARYGFDAIIIDRKNVAADLLEVEEPALLEAESGSIHPGHDCFIIRRRLFDRFVPTDTCIGAGGVSPALTYNMAAFSELTLLVTNAHMIYHFGDDRQWRKNKAFMALGNHNRREYETLEKKLREKGLGARIDAFRKGWDNAPGRFAFFHKPRVGMTRPAA